MRGAEVLRRTRLPRREHGQHRRDRRDERGPDLPLLREQERDHPGHRRAPAAAAERGPPAKSPGRPGHGTGAHLPQPTYPRGPQPESGAATDIEEGRGATERGGTDKSWRKAL